MRTVFEHRVSLRWRDVDALGHVNHAVFLTYLEEGRDAFYVQALGRDPHYVVARVELDLRAAMAHRTYRPSPVHDSAARLFRLLWAYGMSKT